jgi:pimeloyl-ACP methyl ester carboxylesterase
VLPHDERGSGPAVVLLHAGVGDRSMWKEHLGWLAAAGYRAIALDLPGFGEAEVKSGLQAPWEDVLSTLEALGVDRAIVVGNSFGAAVALRMAAVAPAAVSGLILISPPPLNDDPSPELAAAWAAEEAARERGDLGEVARAVADAWVQPDAPPELRERVIAMQRQAAELQAAGGEFQEAADPLEGNTSSLQRLDVPVLTAAGRDDMSDFKQGAEEIARLVPRGQATVIHGAAHLAPLEAPEEFRTLVMGFLATFS